MGDFMSPKKQHVVDRIRERLERCKKHQELSQLRYDSTRDERWSQERQEKDILHQRYQDNRSRRQPKGPKQDGGQNKTKSEGNTTGTGGAEGPGGRGTVSNKHSERKRPHSESTNGPDPPNICGAQANGFDDASSKRPCTEISVQIVQKTGEQTDLTVTTTIQQSGDSTAEASNNNLRSQNGGCKTAERPPSSAVSQSNGQHKEWTEERRQVLEKLLDDPDGLEAFVKQLENDPEQMKVFDSELDKICNKLQQDLGDVPFPDTANMESQPTQEINSSSDTMPMAGGSPAMPNLADGTKLTNKQAAPTMPVAPMVRGAQSFTSVPSPSDGSLKQRVKTEMIAPTSESSQAYDPMMKGPPNTVATDARTGKEGPLPAIAEFKNPAIFDATNIKIEPQASGTVDGSNLLQVQFQQKQGQGNLVNQKQTPPIVNQKAIAQLQSNYRSAQQQHGGPSPGTQLSHYANQQQQQQQQALQQQQQQQGSGITATASQFGMTMSRSLQSLQDQLKQRPHTLAGAIGSNQNPNTVMNRARFAHTSQVTGRLPSMAQIFAQNRSQQVQQVQQQQQQQPQPQQQQPVAFPVDAAIQQVRQNMPGTQQQQLPQQAQQQQTGQFVQQRPTLSLANQRLLRQQMLQRQLLQQQQQSQLQKLPPEQRFLLLTKQRQLVAQQKQKQKDFQMYQRGPPPRYDETQHRNSTFANSTGLMQQTANAATNQMTGGMGNNPLMAGTVRQGAPLQQTLQQGNLHHQTMRTNQTMIPAGQIGTTGTQLTQGMYPNQAQAQYIRSRQQQLLQSGAVNNMQMANQAAQPAGTMLNQLGRSRVQGPNTVTGLGAAAVYMKQQMRGQTPGQMSTHNPQGTSAMAGGNPVAQAHQVSTVVRFPNNLVSTSTNVRTFMQNMPGQNMNLHTSMTTQAMLQQQSYANQPSVVTSAVMQPTNHTEPSIVTAMSSVATPTTHQGSFSANSSHLPVPMDLLDTNVNLGNNTMSNVDFDLDLLENILKTKE
ncbi:mastermind-like protein 3 [Patiria miniata]|uniref:Neurogenic mastermind-like N-terminal domain-containing protein n=1 Tax=Patiria miniata TaxID=46514 RepID=A0A913ZX40_PATMI|nr:mastermind-like protein 3 [Patiria miniata]